MAVQLINSDDEWQQFFAQSAATPLVLMYSANWCGPCKRIFPTFSGLAEQFGDRVAFAKVDVDRAPQTQQEQQIMAMPTFRFHSPDGNVTEARGADQKALQSKLHELLSRCGAASQQQQQREQQQRRDEDEVQYRQGNELVPTVQEISTLAGAEESTTQGALVYDIEADEQWNAFVEDVTTAQMPLIVQFSQKGNSQCNSMQKVFAEAARNYADGCIFARVDIDDAPRVHKLLCNGQQPVPFYTAYDKRGNPIGQFQGARQGKFIDLVHKAIDSAA